MATSQSSSVQLAPRVREARPALSQVRETPEVISALAGHAGAAGITSTEAIRQLIKNYLSQPWAFSPGITKGRKSGAWAPIKMSSADITAFNAHASRDGIPAPEAVRQIVRRYLDESHGKQDVRKGPHAC